MSNIDLNNSHKKDLKENDINKNRQRDSIKNTSRIVAICGVMTALAMIFSYIESLFPIPIPVYGVKLGVANIAIIAVIYAVGSKEAVFVDLLRIVLISLLFGNFNSFIFSISGGLLSIIIMIALKKTKIFSMIVVSVAGGVAHNIGQIIAAVYVMNTTAIVYYLPVLIVAGVVTGVIIGIVGSYIVKIV